jgi:peptidoglycan/xylan/chitin deacetylase (PgdA/CDA1 family)
MTMKAILTFHSIDDSGSVLSFPQAAFASLLEHLTSSGVPLVPLDRLLEADSASGVTITFDDGIESLYTSALPVLRDFAVPAHLFLTTASAGGDNRWPGQPGKAPEFKMLNWEQIAELHAAGIQIEAHTHLHPDLRKLDTVDIIEECEAADRLIEQRLGRRPKYFAYPYGYCDDRVCDCVRGRYHAAVTTDLRPLKPREDLARLPRIDSYYLRYRFLYRRWGSAPARGYLSFRRTLRKLNAR